MSRCPPLIAGLHAWRGGSSRGGRGGAWSWPARSGSPGPRLDPTGHAATASERLLTLVWLTPFVIAWLLGCTRSPHRAEQRAATGQPRAARLPGRGGGAQPDRARAARRHRPQCQRHDRPGLRGAPSPHPEQVVERQALETVESVGREALAEMRRMVGVLRQSGEAATSNHRRGWTSSTGSPRSSAPPGRPSRPSDRCGREPAPGLDLTAYRLVQEGLTNTLRHARNPTGAVGRYRLRDRELQLAVRDDGQRSAPSAPPRERATACSACANALRCMAVRSWCPGDRARGWIRAGRDPAPGPDMNRSTEPHRRAHLRRPGAGARRLPDDPGDRAGHARRGEAVDGDDAVAKVAELAPDVVLMDVRMPGLDGIAATRRLMAQPRAHASGRCSRRSTWTSTCTRRCRRASGFLLKDVAPSCRRPGSGPCTRATRCWRPP